MKNCNSLEEVREEVDKIDEQILKLIAKRKNLIKQAAKFKHSVEEIKTDERVEYVIDRARHLALTLGVNPNMVSEIYTTMINDMVESEISEFQNFKSH